MKRLAIAALIALALTAIYFLGYSAGYASASRSPLVIPSASADRAETGASNTVGPVVSGGAPPPAARPSEVRDLDATEPSASESMRGIINWAAESHGPAYLAIPLGPGHRVSICGPAACITIVSTDAGPDLERQRAGRIADLAVGLWEEISGVPRGYGGFVGTWTLVP